MTQEQELIERLREYGDEPQDVSMGEWAEWSHKSADMIEDLLHQLNEAKNQLDSETFTRERREARCRELHAQLEKAREALRLAEKDIVYAFDALGIPEDKSSVLPVVRNAMSQEGE